MVEIKTEICYRCPYCSERFETEENCSDHIFDFHTDDPIEEDIGYYYCVICKKKYFSLVKAENCELKHSKSSWERYKEEKRIKEGFEKLKEASKHPCQVKLK